MKIVRGVYKQRESTLMNESAYLIFQHEDSLEAGSSNMKTSIHHNTLFVIVIGLFIVSTESAMFPPTHTRHHKEFRKALNDHSFLNRSSDLLVSNLEQYSGNGANRDYRSIPTDNHKLRKRNNHETKESQRSIPPLFGIHISDKPRHKVEVPDFMLDLYKQQVTKNIWTLKSRTYRSTGTNFDVARSIKVEAKGLLAENKGTKTSLKANVDGHHFDKESIRRAELRVYYSPKESKLLSAMGLNIRRKLEIHRISKCKPNCHRKLLDVHYLDDMNPRWMSFDVTDALKSLKKDSKLHLTFELDDVLNYEIWTDGDVGEEIKSMRSNKRMFSVLNDDAKYKPFLVIYSDLLQQPVNHRPKRYSSTAPSKSRKGSPQNRQRPTKQFQKQCSRRSLYVDFAKLDWLEWIVAPSGFDAFMCQGSCQREIQHYNATNHAVLQNLLHSKNSANVPPACCVPTQLSPIALLIVDFDTVVLKNYKDMIVDACGCR